MTHEYWHLGVHVCNEHESNVTKALKDAKDMLNEGVPFDSHCIQDGMIWLGTTQPLEVDVATFIEELHGNGKKFLASVVPFPAIKTDEYKIAQEMGLLFWRNDQLYIGKAFGNNVSYIDYTASGDNITIWLELAMQTINQISSIDGIFIQSSLIDENDGDRVSDETEKIYPYVPDQMSEAMHNLPPWDLAKASSEHGMFELLLSSQNTFAPSLINHICGAIVKATDDQLCMSSTPLPASNYASSVVAKTSSTWFNFAKQIHQVVTASLGGIKLLGAPVCGSDSFISTHDQLCIRWYQFASLLPVFKITSERFVNRFSLPTQRLLIGIIER